MYEIFKNFILFYLFIFLLKNFFLILFLNFT